MQVALQRTMADSRVRTQIIHVIPLAVQAFFFTYIHYNKASHLGISNLGQQSFSNAGRQ